MGVTPCLVNARNMKNVPGRRTDWHECQWLQFLHSVGWLRAAFRPDGDVSAIRSLMRHRNDLVQVAAQHIQHMQKSLTQMNLQIHHVISEITGVTGLAIVDAIIAGERDPAVMAKLRDHRIHASEEVVQKSLVGNWKPEHLFTLKQSRQIYQHYQEAIAACDEEIEKLVVAFEPRVDPDEKPLPPDRKAKQRKRKKRGVTPGVNPKTGFDKRTEAYKLFGVDVTQIPGLMMLALIVKSVATCRGGHQRRSSSHGWGCAPTMILAEDESYGQACAERGTGLGSYFAWRLLVCTMISARSEIIYAE